MTRDLVKNPPALLAKYLRDLDPDADHPRFWYDPAAERTPPQSARQLRNRQLLLERRAGGAPATPETAANALAQIRRDLARRRTHPDPDKHS